MLASPTGSRLLDVWFGVTGGVFHASCFFFCVCFFPLGKESQTNKKKMPGTTYSSAVYHLQQANKGRGKRTLRKRGVERYHPQQPSATAACGRRLTPTVALLLHHRGSVFFLPSKAIRLPYWGLSMEDTRYDKGLLSEAPYLFFFLPYEAMLLT